MTVEPASTRANRINSDSLDWSYIGISFTVGYSTSAQPALRLPGPVRLRGPRQRLRVDILPDVGQSAVPDRDGENPVVLERLVRGFDLPPGEADDEDPV